LDTSAPDCGGWQTADRPRPQAEIEAVDMA